MIPTRPLWETIADLLAADTTGLAEAGGLKVALVTDGLVPGLDQQFGDLVFATFTGSANKTSGAGTQQSFNDPLDGSRCIQILEPAGGWTWICTADPGAPETVIGIALLDNAAAVLLASMLLPTPVTISAAGQAVTVGNLRLTFSEASPY